MMKHPLSLSLLTLFLFFCLTASAQIPLNFGFAGGASYNIYNDNIDSLSQEGQAGWQGGVFARVKFKKLYVGADLLVSSKPGKFSSSSGRTEGEIDLIGMDVPVMLGYKVIKTKVFNLRGFVGPAMHFAFYENVKTKFDGESVSSEDWNINKSPQWSGVAGVGIDVAFLTFDVRYIYSFSNWSTQSDVDLNPQLLQATVGFKVL